MGLSIMEVLMAELDLTQAFWKPWLTELPRLWISPFSGIPPSTEEIKVDIREQPEMFLLEAEMSGVRRESLKVSVDGSCISLEGDIRNGVELPKDERLLLGERHIGHVHRTLDLDVPLDPTKSTAHYEDGLLTVLLYKRVASVSEQTQILVN